MAAAICLLALYPQIDLNVRRGSTWQGAFAYIDTDETAYAAYVNALIDGRPRRNDPYTGKDGLPGVSQSESLFSIQFVPAYLVAVPARVFGLSSSASFILVMVLGALLTAVCC